MKVLMIINEAPYGSERFYNALRLATALAASEGEVMLRLFLIADAAYGVLPGQLPSQGYSIEKMLAALIESGVQIRVCGTCVESRGLKSLALIPGIRVGTMVQLAEWVADADRVLTF